MNAITLQTGDNGEKVNNYSLPNLTVYHSSNNRVDINKKDLTVSGVNSADKITMGIAMRLSTEPRRYRQLLQQVLEPVMTENLFPWIQSVW